MKHGRNYDTEYVCQNPHIKNSKRNPKGTKNERTFLLRKRNEAGHLRDFLKRNSVRTRSWNLRTVHFETPRYGFGFVFSNLLDSDSAGSKKWIRLTTIHTRYCERVLNAVKGQTRQSTICGTSNIVGFKAVHDLHILWSQQRKKH